MQEKLPGRLKNLLSACPLYLPLTIPRRKFSASPGLQRVCRGLKKFIFCLTTDWVRINTKVQEGNTRDMIFKIDGLIAYISQFYTLKIGDLLYTGTPVGVGPVSIGQHLEGYLEGEKLLDFYVR